MGPIGIIATVDVHSFGALLLGFAYHLEGHVRNASKRYPVIPGWPKGAETSDAQVRIGEMTKPRPTSGFRVREAARAQASTRRGYGFSACLLNSAIVDIADRKSGGRRARRRGRC